MHFLSTSVLLALPALTLATSKCSSSSSTRCYTHIEPTPAKSKWQTKWSTYYAPCTSTSTVTKLRTITSALTSSETECATSTSTGPTTIMTGTSTEFTTETDTEVSTVFTSTTVSTETTTSTSTVTAPSGFVPVQSSLPDSSYSGSAGNLNKRTTVDKAIPGRFSSPIKSSLFGNKGKNDRSYVCGVTCNAYRPAKTCKVVKVTTTSSVTVTPTVSTTTTSTIIVTENPSATTTITATETVQVTTTSTTTSTSSLTATETAVASQPFYTGCAPNNFADTIGNQGISGGAGSYGSQTVQASSVYDCCVAALTRPGDAAFGFAYLPSASYCLVLTKPGSSAATCGGSSSSMGSLQRTGDSSKSFTVGNGYCGGWYSTLAS